MKSHFGFDLDKGVIPSGSVLYGRECIDPHDTFGWCPTSFKYTEDGPVHWCDVDYYRRLIAKGVDLWVLRPQLYARCGELGYPECYPEPSPEWAEGL